MTLATAVAQAVRRVDAGVAASEIRPLDSYVNDSLSPRRFGLVLMSAFAITALALAATGIFAVVACAIRERTRELGIRSALGATLSSLARLVSGSVAGAAGVGLVAGLVLAAGTARLLDSLLFDVAALDLATFVEVGVAVAGFALLACLAPAAQLNRVQSRPHRALAAIVD
jgi:ABC-type antimicrobial peptide transport system permease subunit